MDLGKAASSITIDGYFSLRRTAGELSYGRHPLDPLLRCQVLQNVYHQPCLKGWSHQHRTEEAKYALMWSQCRTISTNFSGVVTMYMWVQFCFFSARRCEKTVRNYPASWKNCSAKQYSNSFATNSFIIKEIGQLLTINDWFNITAQITDGIAICK